MAYTPDIFGANIAGEIAKALGPLVFDCVLVTTTSGERDPLNPTGGRVVTETPYTVKGFIDDYEDTNRGGTLIKLGNRLISLLGKSIPEDVTPSPGDFIEIENARWVIVPDGISRDPAGATFNCEVEKVSPL